MTLQRFVRQQTVVSVEDMVSRLCLPRGANRAALRSMSFIVLQKKKVLRVEQLVQSDEQTIAALKHQVDALNARHRLLVQTMLHGVVQHNAQGVIIEMNAAAERILGKNADELAGSSTQREAQHTVREDGSVFPAEEHPSMIALRTGKAVRNIVMGVFNPTLGERRWISIDAVPMFSANSPDTFETFTVFEDITERKIADRALRESEA
jgi:PAS domain S-box-containing protein